LNRLVHKEKQQPVKRRIGLFLNKPLTYRLPAVFIVLANIIFLFACSSRHDEISLLADQSRTSKAYGYTVPRDSLPGPVIIPAGKPRIVMVGKKTEVAGNSITRIAGSPKEPISIKPETKTPGEKGLEVPQSVIAVEKPFFCKAPEVVLVKDAYSKDVNPQNFSSFSKLQGLRHDQIRSMIQDKAGNLWLGTDDGLTKYDGKYFSHYSTDQGLNNNLILSVFQDNKENLWFGSYGGGVTKFDGKYLTEFTVSEGFSNNVVNCIFEDNSDNLWFGTNGGVTKYDGKYFTNFTTKEGLCHNDVRSVLQDDSGRIWISTNGGGISVFDGKSFSNYSEKEGLIQNFITILCKDKKGNIWLGSASKGVMKFDGAAFSVYSEKEGLGNNYIRSIVPDNNGSLWFGSSAGGLSNFDGTYFTNYTESEGLTTNTIRSSLIDRNGNIWLGTRGGGLARFDGNLFTHFTSNEGLSHSRVMCILEDTPDNLWIGTYGGYVTKSSTRVVNGKKVRYFTYFGEKDGLLNSRIYSIVKDREGNIWFGSDGGGVSKYYGETMTTYTTKQGLCSNIIRKIYQDKDGNFWFATYGFGVSKFDGKNFTNYTKDQGLTSNNILSILQDSTGNIWFGTDDGGLTCFNGASFIHYTKKQGFFNNTVYSILQSRDGILWFGTGGDGVIRYDGKVFTRYADDEDHNNNYVLSLLEDSQSKIWAGTRFGLFVIKEGNPERTLGYESNELFKSYIYEDGFIGIGCNIGAITEADDGTIWIGTTDRLTAYHPEGEKSDTIPPNLQITGIQLFNENIPWPELQRTKDTTIVLHNGVIAGALKFSGILKWTGLPENLSLPYNNNYLTFNYIGISVTQNKKIRYQYKLEGVNDNWSAPTSRTEASYGNLFHGDYIFKVKAVNGEGYSGNEVSYHFSIRPPWWQTLGFYLLIVMAVSLSIYLFIINRLRKLKKDKETLEIKVQEQTHEITRKNKELIEQKNEILEKKTAIEFQNGELLKINAEKDKFFSIIAHDLRSPFSGFLGLTEQMAEDLPSMQMDQVQTIAISMKTSATNLYRLLENLLLWAKIQRGLFPFNPVSVQLLPILNESIAMLLVSAQNKNIDIVFDMPEKIEVFADINMLQAIIRNLVSNAVKFTPRGGNIVLSAKNITSDSIEISIKDSGIGMNPSMLNKIFQLDAQSNRSGTDGESSTGLGLLLCKEFVEKHTGRIWVESEEGKGSVFYFTLPGNN
jgi:ligand-binding sensor domain-containing protein/signal transduction histidine kinase